jgi:hypothetical protein
MKKIIKKEFETPQFHKEAILTCVKEIKKYESSHSSLTPAEDKKRKEFIFNSGSSKIIEDLGKEKIEISDTSIKLCERVQKYGFCRYTNVLYSNVPTCMKLHFQKNSFKSTKTLLSEDHPVYLFWELTNRFFIKNKNNSQRNLRMQLLKTFMKSKMKLLAIILK